MRTAMKAPATGHSATAGDGPSADDIARDDEHYRRRLEEKGKRVIAATRLPPSKVPDGLDPLKLAEELESTWVVFEITSRKPTKSRAKLLETIAKSADALLKALRADPDLTWSVRARFPNRPGGRVGVSEYDHFLYTLQALPRAAMAQYCELISERSKHHGLSAFEYTVGVSLVDVFNRHFAPNKATAHRPSEAAVNRTPDTPFIRFAEAALRETRVRNRGSPHLPGAICDAVLKARRQTKAIT